MATRLTKLQIDELSGVDAPANELPGWLIMKSKDELEEILTGLEDTKKDLRFLGLTLEGTVETLKAAPQDVREAVDKVSAYIESELDTGEGEKKSLAQKIVAAFRKTPEPATKSEPAAEPEPEPAAPAEAEADDESAVVKELGDFIKKQSEDTDALREALGSALDEIKTLKERTVGRTGAAGQETEDVTKDGEPTLGDAFRLAALGAKVELR